MKTVHKVGDIQDAFVENKEAKYNGNFRTLVTSKNTYCVKYGPNRYYPTPSTRVIAKRFNIGNEDICIMQRYFGQYSYTVETEHAYNIRIKLINRDNKLGVCRNKVVYLNIKNKGSSLVDIVEDSMRECLEDCSAVTIKKYRTYVIDVANNIETLYSYVPQVKEEVDPLLQHNFDMLADKAIAIHKKRLSL